MKEWKTRWNLVTDPAQNLPMGAVQTWLATSIRDPQRVSFVHNDLKLDNCMSDPAKPDRILAFFGRNRLIDLLDHKVAPNNAN